MDCIDITGSPEPDKPEMIGLVLVTLALGELRASPPLAFPQGKNEQNTQLE